MKHARSVWLTALGAFEAAARHQNFAHAAEELHLTASAVSHHVRKLEEHLGVRLFQRHARGVVLTPEGRLLADAAGNALIDIDAVIAAIRPGRHDVRIRVATLHSFAQNWLLPRLPDFLSAHPDIRLSIETEVALTRFDDDGPELGIRHGPGQWPGLVSVHLLDEVIFPVASPRFPDIDQITGPADIARLPLIADLTRQGWPDWFREAGIRGVRLGEMHSFSDATDALQAAAHGLGAALSRSRIVSPWLASGRLRRLPGPAMTGRFGYHLIHAQHRPPGPAARSFMHWLQAQAFDDRADDGLIGA